MLDIIDSLFSSSLKKSLT